MSITVPDDEPGVGSIVLRKALSFAGVLLLAFVLLWLTPLWETVDRKYYGAPFGRYAKAFGIGFAVLAGVPLAAILLFISNVGVRLALIVLFLYAAAIIAAPVFLGFFLGALLWRGAMKKAPCYYAELAIGILVWRVAASVPGLSFAVGLVSVPLGLGVVTLLLGKGAGEAVAQGGDGLRGERGVRPRSAAGGQRQRGAISPYRTAKRDRSGGLFFDGNIIFYYVYLQCGGDSCKMVSKTFPTSEAVMKKRTLFLGFLLMLALSTAALAADYTDVPADSWARESIDKAAEYGLMNGVGGGALRPRRDHLARAVRHHSGADVRLGERERRGRRHRHRGFVGAGVCQHRCRQRRH